jgi:aryl carrier-like protein
MYDGWSLRLLHQAVHQCYGSPSIVINASSDLITGTLAEIVLADNPYAAEFWQGYLAKAMPCLVSADKHSTLAVGSAVHLKERKSFFTLDRIHGFCREEGVTLQALGQLCWTMVLASQTGDLEVLFGIVLSCRDTLDSQKIMFPMMNTVAFRSLVRGSRHDMLRYTQDTMSSIREFQQFPLRKAQRFANVQDGKLFDSVFIFQKTPETAANSDHDLYKSIRTESSVEYAVCVEMEEVGHDLIWRIACQGEIFTEEETNRLLSHLNDALVDIVGDSSAESVEINGDELRFGSLPPCLLNLRAEASQSSGRQGHTLELGELNSTDKAIRSVLSEVSKIPETDISTEQTIFQLGLDSISVMKVAALLRQQSIYLSVSELVKASNIHEMARIADSHAEKQDIVSDDEPLPEFDIDGFAKELGINTNQIERVIPATAGQTYTLSSWRVSEGALFYPTFEFEVTGAVSTEAMQASWAKVVDQNPILRTVFVMTDSLSMPVVQIVIRSGANATVEQSLVKLAIGPKQNDRWPLQLRLHHALYDAHSLRRLIRQFECFLRGHAEVVGGYESLSTLVRRAYKPSAISRAKAFWTMCLDGMHTAHKLPVSRSAAPADVRCYTPDFIDRRYRSLQTMARYYGVGVPQLFIAAWAKLYNGMTDKHAPDGTKNPDVIIGVYLANRPFATGWVEGLDEVAAPTLNLVPLRVRSPGSKGIVEVAMEIQSDLLEIGSLEVAMTNLWSIKEWTGVTVDNFVNFLPRSQDTTSNSVVNVNAIRIVDVDKHDVPISEVCSRTEGSSRESVQQSGGPVQKLFNDLGHSKIVEAYPVSPHP